MKNFLYITFAALSVLLAASGCSEGDERRHPLFRQGENALNSGHALEALQHFYSLIKRRPNCVYAHLRLASVYDELLDDPLNALIHYNYYLTVLPNAPDAEEVAAWKLRAEKRCYELLKERFDPPELITGQGETQAEAAAGETATAAVGTPDKAETTAQAESAAVNEQPSESQVKSENPPAVEPVAGNSGQAVKGSDAANELTEKDQEIAELKDRLARFQARYRFMQMELEKLRAMQKNPAVAQGSISNSAAPLTSAPTTAAATGGTAAETLADGSRETRQYTVQSGDTPGRIARKFYGKSSLYTLILRANPQVDPRRMRPGTVLIIPPVESK
ncbi:MAG: LysM peptidoglycan-binding domain-containing protein [Lentisphaerae bacterium]|nr:LysM peptidoglycan-binding domain-containing protein [Lentisphaerota bacterium]